MADREILRGWFEKIEQDLAFLYECFGEMLREIGQNDLARSLEALQSGTTNGDPIAAEQIRSELQMLAIAFHLLNIVEENAAAEARNEREDRLGLLTEPGMLDSARGYVLGQYPLRLETAANWAAALADLEFYGLGKDYIEGYGPALARVDQAEAAAVTADAFPRPTDLVVVLIGDAASIRETAAKYGPVTEMKLSHPDFSPAN